MFLFGKSVLTPLAQEQSSYAIPELTLHFSCNIWLIWNYILWHSDISSCISVLVTMEVSYQCSFPSQTSIGGKFTTVHRKLDIPSLNSQVYMQYVLTLSCRLGFALLARSSSTTLWWPLKLARCSAVKPSCRVECNHMKWLLYNSCPTTWQVHDLII